MRFPSVVCLFLFAVAVVQGALVQKGLITVYKPEFQLGTTTTTLQACPKGCNCLTEDAAAKEFTEYDRCGGGVCGYSTGGQFTALVSVPRYCFREAETQFLRPTTTTTLRRLQRPTLPEGSVGCNSCESCTRALREGNKYVVATSDFASGHNVDCVTFDGVSDAVFDCMNHTISGFETGIEFYTGIQMVSAHRNTVRNCVVEGFGTGVATYSSTHNLFLNDTVRRNYDGVWLGGGRIDGDTGEVVGGSDYNSVVGNTIVDNGQHGLSVGSHTAVESNRLCGNAVADIYTSPYGRYTGNAESGNVCDLIFNWNGDGDVTWCDATCTGGDSTQVGSAAGLAGALGGEYGAVNLTGDVAAPSGVKFNASHVTLDCNGHRITGSGSGTGISIANKVNVEVRGCVIEKFDTALSMDSVSHSRVLSNTMRDNNYGIVLRSGAMPSRGSNISGNTAKPNGIYGLLLLGDVFGNAMANNSLGGGRYSLYVDGRCDNDIGLSNTGGSGKRIGYFHDAHGLTVDYGWGGRDFSQLIACNVTDSSFQGVTVANPTAKTDGIIVLYSARLAFTNPAVTSPYQGVTVRDSTGIRLQGLTVDGAAEDCVSVSQSAGVTLDGGRLRGCKRGVYLAQTSGSIISRVENIEAVSVAGIELYMSGGNNISRVKFRDGLQTAKGIVLSESSTNNRLTGNVVSGLSYGVWLDQSSTANRLQDNILCDNTNDLYAQGGGNGGTGNNCTTGHGWKDDGVGSGCSNCCSHVRNDVNRDGIDDACDCFDAQQGTNEQGVDCGGRCGPCVGCTWCNGNVEPIRIKGEPNDGMIDVVFVPHENFRDNLTQFRQDALLYVREHYLKLADYTIKPIPADYRDSFNFYFYKGGYGKDGDCAGKLPGEDDYSSWIAGCSAMCAFSLGLGCGCFAYEPDHFYKDAGWADTAGILTMTSAGCANVLGPQSHFIAERAYPVVIHESGHAVFGLVDEYCGHTLYTQNNPHPNVWSSMSGCTDYSSDMGWRNGSCRRIQEGTCSKGYYRYDPDAPIQSYMIVWGSGWDYRFWEAASERISYVFTRYPGGGSRGILIYVRHDKGGMRELGLTVVPGHPDQGLQVPVYWVEVLSPGGGRIREFGMWDNRMPLASGPGSASTFLDNVTFPLNIPFEGNPRWVNIYNATSGELELSMDIGPGLYGWCAANGWTGDDCGSLDVDGNKIPDVNETRGWKPLERLVNKTFHDWPGISQHIEELAPKPPAKTMEGTKEGGLDPLLIIGAIVILLLLATTLFFAVSTTGLAALLVAKLRKKGGGKK